MSNSKSTAYGVTIITATVTIEREIQYTASCGHTETSTRFIASSAIVDRIAADLGRKPCSRCMERLPIMANRSAWRVTR